MKKLLSMLLAVAMTATLAVTAFADDTTAPASQLSLKDYTNGAQLTPGTSYEYEILLDGQPLVDLEGGRLTANVTKGGNALSVKVEETKDGHKLVVDAKEQYGTQQVEASFRLRLTQSGSEAIQLDQTAKVGFDAMPGDQAGEELTISNSTPILSQKVLEDFAEANRYRKGKMNSEDGKWSFEVNTGSMKNDINMTYSYSIIPQIMQKYENQEFTFLSFPGRPDFGGKGRVTVDVSDLYDTESWGTKFYLYLFQDSKLYKLTTTLDADELTLSFNASRLGSYVITNKEITDGGIITGAPSNSSGGSQNPNPDTGANDMIGLAAALGAVALVSMAAISLKKK